jgi:hypothetical protein
MCYEALVAQFLHPPATISLFYSNILFSTVFSNTLSLYYSLKVID